MRPGREAVNCLRHRPAIHRMDLNQFIQISAISQLRTSSFCRLSGRSLPLRGRPLFIFLVVVVVGGNKLTDVESRTVQKLRPADVESALIFAGRNGSGLCDEVNHAAGSMWFTARCGRIAATSLTLAKPTRCAGSTSVTALASPQSI